VSLILRGSLPEQVEDKNRGDHLTQVHVENGRDNDGDGKITLVNPQKPFNVTHSLD